MNRGQIRNPQGFEDGDGEGGGGVGVGAGQGGGWSASAARAAEAMVTITLAGSRDKIVRRGTFGGLLEGRTVEGVLTEVLDTHFLSSIISQGAAAGEETERAAEAISSALWDDYRVCVRRDYVGSNAPGTADTAVAAPAEENAGDLATRSLLDYMSTPCYSLHLHLSAAHARAISERPYEERLEALKRHLRPRIEALNLSGLFRGNRQTEAEAMGED